MTFSRQLLAFSLSTACLPLLGGCNIPIEPDDQRCVDYQDRVVVDRFCTLPPREVHLKSNLYEQLEFRLYYGGYGGDEPGDKAWGGSERPLSGHIYRSRKADPTVTRAAQDSPQPYVVAKPR